MKTLRLLFAGVVLLAACEGRDPVSPPPAPLYQGGSDSTSIANCDSTCRTTRSPQLGSSGGR